VIDTRSLLLKAGATALTLAATVVSALYVTSHLKNPNAPLQPAVLSASRGASVGLPGGGTLTLSPSVRPSDVEPVTSTYAS
jgi:hypothetical protein